MAQSAASGCTDQAQASEKHNEILPRCYNCKRWLSVLPVQFNPSLQDYLCGRCSHTNDSNVILHPVPIYDQLAKRTTFPCSYREDGCSVQLKHNEVEGHELHCLFQTIDCPHNSQDLVCDWSGILDGLENHFEEKHREGFHGSSLGNVTFKMECEVSNTQMHSAITNDALFLIFAVYSDATNTFKFAVLSTKLQRESYQYDLQLQSPGDCSGIVHFRKNKVKLLQYHAELLRDQDDMLEVDMGWIKSTFNTNEVLCTFKIASTYLEEADVTGSSVRKTDIKILEHLECPICNFLMVPPIYFCTRGHSLCGDCRWVFFVFFLISSITHFFYLLQVICEALSIL